MYNSAQDLPSHGEGGYKFRRFLLLPGEVLERLFYVGCSLLRIVDELCAVPEATEVVKADHTLVFRLDGCQPFQHLPQGLLNVTWFGMAEVVQPLNEHGDLLLIKLRVSIEHRPKGRLQHIQSHYRLGGVWDLLRLWGGKFSRTRWPLDLDGRFYRGYR